MSSDLTTFLKDYLTFPYLSSITKATHKDLYRNMVINHIGVLNAVKIWCIKTSQALYASAFAICGCPRSQENYKTNRR